MTLCLTMAEEGAIERITRKARIDEPGALHAHHHHGDRTQESLPR
jgi:hypothetical protein